MNILDLIKDFKEKKIINTQIKPNAVCDYLKEKLEVKDYLPFADKRELCANVLNACNTKDESGFVKVDSVSRYIVFTISMISAYTNLEFSSGDEEFDSLDEYDMLCQNKLLNPILEVIGDEYATCNNLLNMMMDDIIANNNTIEAMLGNALGKVIDSIDGLIDTLADKVDELNLDLSQIDIDKYKGLLDLLPKK